MNRKKVVAIGIDGGEFTVFDRMVKKGLMPNLEQIMKKSFVSMLDTSVQGPGQGWVSFITGKSPQKHGVYYWTLYKKLVNAKFIKDKCLWDILGEHGLKSCVINMSYTHPPSPLNGFMIAGLGSGLNPADNLKLTYPHGLMDEIQKEIGGYIPACEYKEGSIDDHIKLVQDLITMTRLRTKSCLYIMDRYKPDFVLIVYRGADLIQHGFWNLLEPGFCISEKSKPLRDLIDLYYGELDRSIAALWKKYDNSANLIISDHGFGPVKAVVYVNYYLAEKGFLSKAAEKLRSNVKRSTYARSLLKYTYHKTLKRYSVFERLNRLRKELHGLDLPIDMSKTIAYCDAFGGININKKTSLITDAAKTKQELVRCLKELKDPRTNEHLMEKIYLKEDSFAKNQSDAPDVIFEAKEHYFLSYLMPANDDRVFRFMDTEETAFFSGGHRRDGVLIVDGDGLKFSKEMKGINITDVSATILGLFGVNKPADCDGRMLCNSTAEF